MQGFLTHMDRPMRRAMIRGRAALGRAPSTSLYASVTKEKEGLDDLFRVWFGVCSHQHQAIKGTAISDAYRRIFYWYDHGGRQFYTLERVRESLAIISVLGRVAAISIEEAHLLSLAAFFKDTMYFPWIDDPEQRSADFAYHILVHEMGLDHIPANNIWHIILATKRDEELTEPLGKWMADIHLYWLSLPGKEFGTALRKFKQEFKWLPTKSFINDIFNPRFVPLVEQSNIYHTQYFRNTVQDRARKNLEQAISDFSSHV